MLWREMGVFFTQGWSLGGQPQAGAKSGRKEWVVGTRGSQEPVRCVHPAPQLPPLLHPSSSDDASHPCEHTPAQNTSPAKTLCVPHQGTPHSQASRIGRTQPPPDLLRENQVQASGGNHCGSITLFSVSIFIWTSSPLCASGSSLSYEDTVISVGVHSNSHNLILRLLF